MAIKVQVKDNRGCTSTFTNRFNSSVASNGIGASYGTCTPNFGVGVTPINHSVDASDWYGTYAQPMSLGTFGQSLPAAAYGHPMTFGMLPQSDLLSTTATQGMLPVVPGFQGNGSCPVHSTISRIAAMNPALGLVAMQIAAIDPTFVASLGNVANGCAWTASKLMEVARIDLALAREITKVAALNPAEGITLAQLATVNPIAAAQKLANLGWNGQAMAQGRPFATGFNRYGFSVEAPNFSMMPIDVRDNGKAWIVEADLPGVSIDDVDITAVNGRLIIEAILGSKTRSTLGSTLSSDVRQPRVLRREFAIGLDVETTEISARIVNGVLSIVLPKKLATNASEQYVSREGTLVG